MSRSGLRALILLTASAVGALTIAGTAAHADSDTDEKVMLKGSTTASYFWDDSSGRAGDTGLPASGKPMQKGLAASPSWPLMTEGYVVYKGKKMPFFVGDRGPGEPSSRGVMLDLDAKTFAALTGGRFNSSTLGVDGVGGQGHIEVDYVITKWGSGVGKKNYPVAFSTGAWSERDNNPAEPPQPEESSQGGKSVPAADENADGRLVQEGNGTETEGSGNTVGTTILAGALAAAGGGAVLGGERIRALVRSRLH
ncbi:hypothetical protein [Nonomuraea zeae]|uniref:hypothetical protein n=1 Tax=Nonomuraea zeae TaxID=1642303 RepID=UPI00268A94EB